MGETRVDLLHLLEDLRDAYPGALEETILTEIVANSLDSGAAAVALTTDSTEATLTVTDDGRGMSRRELSRYHDLAATTKQRGKGIGFAGVGIKLGLLACDQVITETRRGKTHVATLWHLKSSHRAPWKWIPPSGVLGEHGTAVRLKLANPLSPLLEPGFLEATIQRHFQPLFDSGYYEILSGAYPDGVLFTLNGCPVDRLRPVRDRAPLGIRLPRKRKHSGYGYLVRAAGPLPEVERGVAISTLGKVIKGGWDWLGVTPAAPEQVGGLIEVPALAECLTLSKGDFIRTGQRGATYLAYRKAIQEAVAVQLAAWGDMRDAAEQARRKKTRPIERDLQTVLADLAEQFPLLASLVDRRPGGQRRLALGRPGSVPEPSGMPAVALVAESEPEAPETAPHAKEPEAGALGERRAPSSAEGAALPGAGRKRPARYGLAIRFESRPDDPELGRLVESTVWINEAHPAYQRAVTSRSEGYHLALTVAMALAPLAVEPVHVHAFVTAFLALWGETARRRVRRR